MEKYVQQTGNLEMLLLSLIKMIKCRFSKLLMVKVIYDYVFINYSFIQIKNLKKYFYKKKEQNENKD